MRASKTQIKLICVLKVVAAVLAPAAPGADRFWTNSAGGNFNATANWFANSVPGAADNANFTNKASYQVNWTAIATNASAFFNTDSGTVTQAIGAVSWLLTNRYVVGQDSSSTATVTHTTGTLRVTNGAGTAQFIIGQGSKGIFNLNGGAVVADYTEIGFNPGAASNRVIVTGSGSVLSNAAGVIVGYFGPASLLSITNGGLVTAEYAGIGDSSSNNVLIVGGSGSELRLRNTNGFNPFLIGGNGSGNRLVVTNGGRATSYLTYLSDDAGSTNNSALVGGPGSVWTNTSSIDVGKSGPGNRLDIVGGGQMWAGDMYLGALSDSSNNTLVVSGPGSTLTLARASGIGELNIGYQSSGNSLLLTNGGTIISDWGGVGIFGDGNTGVLTGTNSLWSLPAGDFGASLFQIGQDGSSNRLSVLAGARMENSGQLRMGYSPGMNGNLLFVSGAGTTYSNGSSISLGTGGSGNQIVVSNGATLIASSSQLGLNTNADRNIAIVTGSGAVWTNSLSFIVGSVGVSNSLVVSNGGSLFCTFGTIGNSANATRNVAIVTGPNSIWTNLSSLTVNGGLNRLLISNGGKVYDSAGSIGSGSGANGNSALITGAGSVWSNRTSLTVGGVGSLNQLVISNGGMVLCPGLTIGTTAASSNNICLVAGGTLHVTNAAATAVLDIRRGTNRLNSGWIEADVLLLTNTAGAVDLNGGNFLVRNSSVTNGQPLVVGDGVGTAYYDLVGNGIHAFNDGLIVQSNSLLYGNGTVIGPVIALSGGILEPAGHTGKITLNSPPLLQGMIVLEIRRTGATVTNAQVQVNGGLTYGGVLEIVDDSPNPVMAGDRFPLFNATSYSGAFSSLNLPLLPFGLGWTNKLLIDGSIEVVALPPGDRFWTNSLGGNYQYAANWLDWHGPSEADNATFTNNASYQVNWIADAAAANAFFNASSGTVTQAVGGFSWLLTNAYVIGQNLGSTAAVTHTTGTLQVTNSAGTAALIVGQDGQGTYNLQGGAVIADRLLATNNSPTLAGSDFNFDFGSLTTLHSCVITQSGSFIIGTLAGQSAAWNVPGGTNAIGLSSGSVTLGGPVGSQGSLLVSGLGTVWSQNRGLLVGSNGSLSSLTISNGARLFATGVTLGSASGSTNNLLMVSDTNSLLALNGSMSVGNLGRGNQLFVLNGAVVSNTSTGVLGSTATGDGNLALVSGPGSAWLNGSFMNIGSVGASNRVIVANGALLKTVGGLVLGNTAGADTNSALITDAGSVWTDTGTVTVGSSIGNSLVISNGGHFHGVSGMVGGAITASNNLVLVTGSGSVWSNSSTFTVGRFGRGSSMIVSNGASVIDSALTIGSSAIGSNNFVLVTGSGSVWSNTSSVIVGSSGTGATLVVSNGGSVIAGSLTVGDFPTSTNSVLTVTGGNLFGGGSSGELNPLIVGAAGQGTLNLNGGTVTAARLFLTNGALSVINFNSGQLNVRTSSVANAQTFFVGNGSNSATLNLVGNGQHSFANGLTVRSNSSVIGNGSISGVLTVQAGALVAPGTSIGTILLSNAPSLQGTMLMEISKSGAAITNDQVQTTGTLTYGAALIVTNIGPDPLVGGERFPLFTATSFAGAFASITLPPLPFGLVWTNNLLVDGSIGVAVLTTSDRFWTNRLGGSYQVAGNWLDSAVPLVLDNANFTNNATYQVNWTADASAANAFFNAGSGTVTQAIGAFSWLLTNSYIVGQSGASTASVALVSGTLHVANAAGTGLLEVRRGTNRLNGGLMDVDQLVLTNKAGKFEFNGGTLITRGATITNNTFNVGNSGGTPAVWDVRTGTNVATFGVQIGRDAVGSRLLLTNGGKLFTSGGFVGFGSTARSNVAVIAGAGSVWNTGNDFDFGGGGNFNQVTVSNAGAIFDSDAIIGNGGGTNNTMLVTGAGSVWSNDASLTIAGSFNQLLVSGGGTVLSSSSIIDSGDTTVARNSAVVTGVGSTWSFGTLYVGSSSSVNQLMISNGAVVFGTELDLGFDSTSTNNRAVVAGGELRVTNAVFNAVLDIRRGTNQLNSGLIEADRLLATNTLGIFEFNGGTLNVRTSTVTNAQTFFAGNGTSAATFKLVGNGSHSFANGLTIRSNASLVGNGTIAGTLSVQSGGTLSPGTSVGTLALNSTPVLQGQTVMEISKNGSVLTNDQVQVGGTLNYGGVLMVTNIGPGTLSAGDQFQLFNAPGYSGSFSSTILPPLNAGLRWNNNLLVNGSIGVGVIPPPAAIPLSGGTYTQDFNTLATNGLANTWDGGYTLFGWFAGESLSPLTITSYRAGSGTDLTGALYSFGSSGSNERALGSLASATPGTIGFGVCFTNDTAASVSNFTVSYTGEQWRSGGSGSVTNTLSFWYRVGAPPLTNPEPGIVVNWTAVTNLFFPSPIVSATAGALDGNQAANQHVLAATSIPGLIVPPGQEVFFRWTDPDDAGFDQAMAVDDLTVAFTILAPRISSIASNPTNHFATISGIGEPGFTYGIEAASNLNAPVFWQRLGSVTADTTGIFQFTDTNAPLFQVRFYRTLIP